MKRINLLLMMAILLLSSCAKDNLVRMTVASEKRMAMGVAPMEVLLVKEGNAKDWTFFYSNIEGFDYAPGYEYVLDVKKETLEMPVPSDASSIKYILVKEVSKTEKISENMLKGIVSEYVWNAKVLEVKGEDVGEGGAAGQFPVEVAKVLVTSQISRDNTAFNIGDTIYVELSGKSEMKLDVDKEYSFKAKHVHPAHALGVYMLEAEVRELIK